MNKAWERMKGESGKSFKWFTIYRDLGAKRSLKKVITEIEKLNKSKPIQSEDSFFPIPVPTHAQLKNQSRTWDWVERAGAYDNHMDELARKQKEEDYLAIESRLVGIGETILDNLERNLNDLKVDVDSKTTSISHALKSAADAYDKSVKDIRLLYGKSTENTNSKEEVSTELTASVDTVVDITSDDFMNNELKFMKELLNND